MSGVGHAVLYAAFAVVALWLLGELLLQHRAEPHWRALALLGFLGLVAGVAQGSLPLIAAGVVGFGVGQFLVSRSVRTGGRTHWSLRSADGALPGPLAGLPLLGSVFPAGETPAAARPLPGQRVGEVGPVEPVEPPEPVQEQQAYGYEQQPYEYAPTEYQQQQPVYAEYDYSQQQQQQQPQYDYTGYDQYQQQPQPQPQQQYDYQQPQQYEQYDYGQQQPQPQPQYDYTGYEQQPQQQPQAYVYQPEPMDEPEPEPWQPYPQQYS